MFGITFASNGIIVGVVLGFIVGAMTNNLAIGIVVAITASAVLYFAIRAIEAVIERGATAGTKAVQNRMNARRDQSDR